MRKVSKQNKHHIRKKSIKGQAPKVTLTFEQFAAKMEGKLATAAEADAMLKNWAARIKGREAAD